MAEEEDKLEGLSEKDLLLRIAKELKTIRVNTSKALFAMGEAESEIPEKMRRFANYWHDVVHIKEAYVTMGLSVPIHIDREMERNADRFRQILKDLHSDTGAFEKVRRDMANDPENYYDHTRQLAAPKKEPKP